MSAELGSILPCHWTKCFRPEYMLGKIFRKHSCSFTGRGRKLLTGSRQLLARGLPPSTPCLEKLAFSFWCFYVCSIGYFLGSVVYGILRGFEASLHCVLQQCCIYISISCTFMFKTKSLLFVEDFHSQITMNTRLFTFSQNKLKWSFLFFCTLMYVLNSGKMWGGPHMAHKVFLTPPPLSPHRKGRKERGKEEQKQTLGDVCVFDSCLRNPTETAVPSCSFW